MVKKFFLAVLLILAIALIALLAWFGFQSFVKQNESSPIYLSSLSGEKTATFTTDKSDDSASLFALDLSQTFTLPKGEKLTHLPLKILAPTPDFMDIKDGSYLPKISHQGIEPYDFYKARFDIKSNLGKAKLAIVLTGLGLQKDLTKTAINDLPSAITLSFSPYAEKFIPQIIFARENGHETMVDLYLEQKGFFSSPTTILKNLPLTENLARITNTLTDKGAITGVATLGGFAFTTDRAQLAAVQKFVMDRGLIYLENDPDFPKAAGITAGGVFINANAVYHQDLSTKDIILFLKSATDSTLDKGKYIIILPISKATLKALMEARIEGIFADIVLAPLTAMITKKEITK